MKKERVDNENILQNGLGGSERIDHIPSEGEGSANRAAEFITNGKIVEVYLDLLGLGVILVISSTSRLLLY